ncbi:MAG TPA: sigma-70 family RNA polymerase sigma factor [Planctomycetaceae bacterium]|jgi:RNA polymerase sigma-70 factor (ECF subfamily)|nr:sigma-70 family RNA polymerase sigma factor [Planctomycetaceae bacterium]
MSFLTPELLAQLIDAHAAALELFAAQWSKAPTDVVQEAFVELARQPKRPDNIVAWLYRVVRHRAYDDRRAESRRRRRETVAAAENEPWFRPTSWGQIVPQDATEALRELPDDLREVVVARIWCGLTFEQIGEIAETSAATAFRRHQQALSLLRSRLGIACLDQEKTSNA